MDTAIATIALAVALTALAVTGLAIGVVLGKRTPLTGSCHEDGAEPCETCSCDPNAGRD